MVIDRTLAGGMNTDVSRYALRSGEYPYARNVVRYSNDKNRNLIGRGIRGNRMIAYSGASVGEKTVGEVADVRTGRIYFIVYNPNNEHEVRMYDDNTQTVTKVLRNIVDTGGEDILKISKDKKITGIDIIRFDNEDYICWTDGLSRPKKFSIDKMLSGAYGVVTESIINAAKKQPLDIAVAEYDHDAGRKTNGLRNALFQFTYRWVFDDMEKSTWASYSKTPMPKRVEDSEDDDFPDGKNNVLNVTVNSGDKNVVAVEIAVRKSIGGVYGDYQLMGVYNKKEMNIADNTPFTVNFYNDSVYPPLDQREIDLLFDYHPLKAESQVVLNGNVLAYGDITEGYDKIAENELLVGFSTENIEHTQEVFTTGEIEMLFQDYYFIEVGIQGAVVPGSKYIIRVAGVDFGEKEASYIAEPGDTIEDVARELSVAFPSDEYAYVSSQVANYFLIHITGSGFYATFKNIEPPSGLDVEERKPATWNWFSSYRIGFVYLDEYGNTNGVVKSYEVKTKDFSVNSNGNPQTPVIHFSINHAPPPWAKKIQFVRSVNLSFSRFYYHITSAFQQDEDYMYFCIGNLTRFAADNTNFIYPKIDVSKGDRIKILGKASTTGRYSDIRNDDYEIVGIEERGLSSANDENRAEFIKVKKRFSFTYPDNSLVMIYTPFNIGGVQQEDMVYYEFGQAFDIYEDNGNRYHRGMNGDDQTDTDPALYTFTEGDVYYRKRDFYINNNEASKTPYQNFILDKSISDYYDASVNSNGRPMVLDINAKQRRYEGMIRYSQEYFYGTNVSGLNRFYHDSFMEVDVAFGAIKHMRVRGRQLRIWQKFKVGVMPIYESIQKVVDGRDSLVISDRLLNPIHYMQGEYGVGDCPESIASNNFNDYFVDNNRGAIIRWSLDGLTPLSIIYNVNWWATTRLPKHKGQSKVYGVFDAATSKYFVSCETLDDEGFDGIVFNEKDDFFDCYHDMTQGEGYINMGTMLFSFKSGQIFRHDNEKENSFFGEDFKSTLEIVFNDGLAKKSFTTLSLLSSQAFNCNIFTDLNQESELKDIDFKHREGSYHAAFLRDKNSPKGLLRGDTLKGKYISIIMEPSDMDTPFEFISASVNYNISQLNKR